MVQVIATTLPKSAFLNDYEHRAGVYTDCFQTELPQRRHSRELHQRIFQHMALSHRTHDPQHSREKASLRRRYRAIGARHVKHNVRLAGFERRDADQILLEVPQTPIRTWLMRSSEGEKTQLYFGSAILPDAVDRNGNAKMPFLFHALLGFHKLYARALLFSAKRALR